MLGTLVLLLLGLNAQSVATPPQATQAAAEPAAIPACGDCHEQAKTFAANPHGRGVWARPPSGATALPGAAAPTQIPNAACETCHGDGTAHIEAGGDKEKIFKPVGKDGADGCLACHELGSDRISRHAGVHANSATVNCLTCHSIHAFEPREPHLLAKSQLALCSSCHSTQVSSFRNKPFAHRVGRGGMNCSSCHEPHGRPARESLRSTSAGELTCLNCHTDKRGPFVFQHGAGAVGDCLTCHEAHGSSNPKRLKRANVWQLCSECHSPLSAETLGSQPPSFHNLSNPRYLECTKCHVAIHGSNRSPQLFK